jgi:hypothetical protein
MQESRAEVREIDQLTNNTNVSGVIGPFHSDKPEPPGLSATWATHGFRRQAQKAVSVCGQKIGQ